MRPRKITARNDRASLGPATRRRAGRLLLVPSLLITLKLESLHAQNAPARPDLMDMGLEDLMKIKTDSVYGASGYKQKVTEAPASIAIVTADKTGTGCGSRSTWMPPRKPG